MRFDDDLLAILACPACHAPLRVDESRDDVDAELVCTGCGLAYPVRDDIPVLLVDQARRPEQPSEQSPDGEATGSADGG